MCETGPKRAPEAQNGGSRVVARNEGPGEGYRALVTMAVMPYTLRGIIVYENYTQGGTYEELTCFEFGQVGIT